MPIRKKRRTRYQALKSKIINGDDYHLPKRRKEITKSYKSGKITKVQRDKLRKLAR